MREVNFADGDLAAGADWEIQFNVVNEVTDLPLDMSGYSLQWVVRNYLPEGAVILFRNTPAEIVIENGAGANSRATVRVPSATTLPLKRGKYYHALWRTDDPSDKPLAHGYFNLIGIAKQ